MHQSRGVSFGFRTWEPGIRCEFPYLGIRNLVRVAIPGNPESGAGSRTWEPGTWCGFPYLGILYLGPIPVPESLKLKMQHEVSVSKLKAAGIVGSIWSPKLCSLFSYNYYDSGGILQSFIRYKSQSVIRNFELAKQLIERLIMILRIL